MSAFLQSGHYRVDGSKVPCHLKEDAFTLLLSSHGCEPIVGLYPQDRQFVNVHGYAGMQVGAGKLHLGDKALLGIERNKPCRKASIAHTSIQGFLSLFASFRTSVHNSWSHINGRHRSDA